MEDKHLRRDAQRRPPDLARVLAELRFLGRLVGELERAWNHRFTPETCTKKETFRRGVEGFWCFVA